MQARHLMSNATLIVCEKSGRWAAALRSAWVGGLQVTETRALSQCESALRPRRRRLLRWKSRATSFHRRLILPFAAGRDFTTARLIVLLSDELHSAEPLLREAGAIDRFHAVHRPTRSPAWPGGTPHWRKLKICPLRQSIAARLPWEA